MSRVKAGSREIGYGHAAQLQRLVSFVANSPIRVPDIRARRDDLMLQMPAPRSGSSPAWSVRRRLTISRANPAASWTARHAFDIDGEVLRWIASHVNGRKGRAGR
jgi:hypothetical protein